MSNKIYDMKFKKVFQLLIDKAEKKGKTRQDVIILTNWLTGYSSIQIEQFFNSDISYGDFLMVHVILMTIAKILQEKYAMLISHLLRMKQ